MHPALFAALLVTAQDTSRFAPLAKILDDAIAAHAFPGAVVAVGRHDSLLYLHAAGALDYLGGARVTTTTIYDIASLTKVVGLTTALMQLVEAGRVELDAPAVRYVPTFHDSAITVRQLLTHSSGLPAWRPFWQRVHSKADMYALVNAEPLEQPPGAKMAYSDLGAMVLTQIVENVTGMHIDAYLAEHVFRPLGMRETRYLPPPEWLERIAPTEVDTTYRHHLVRGEVHDENAFSMGGVSGHAGLFSTAPDLALFARALLGSLRMTADGARQPGATTLPAVHAPTAAEFTRVQRPGFSSRALGWDTPSENSSAGSRLSARSFGHTGFTGTSMWMDPEKDLFVILLTNRVNPTRENTRIFQVRREVADSAAAIAGR